MIPELLAQYIEYIVAASIALYIVYSTIDSKIKKLDGAIIESLNGIAQNLDGGNSIEASIMAVSQDKSNAAAKCWKEIIKEAKKGSSFEDSLKIVSKRTKSETFAYVCDIIYLSQRSSANISDSLKKLSQNLWEIDLLQTSVNTKASGPLTTLKVLGIALIPLIYYFMASLLSSDTVTIQITLPFQIYFAAVSLAMTFSDYLMFGDFKDGLFLLPFSASYLFYVIIKLGPSVGQLLL
jgi:Flp pilus assembly protein TadB